MCGCGGGGVGGGGGGGVLMNVFVQWQQHGGCLKFSLAFGVTVW